MEAAVMLQAVVKALMVVIAISSVVAIFWATYRHQQNKVEKYVKQ